MAIVSSNEILMRVNKLLNDPNFTRWTKEELLNYLNDAQRAIVLRRPDSYTVDTDDFTCVEGTKQLLPVDALKLIDVTRNESGKAIRGPYNRQVLDDNYDTWYAGKESSEVELYIYDERNPKTFYVYPGVIADVKLTLVYSKAPPAISLADNEAGEVIALDDIYVNAIIEWILYRSYMKDAEYAANPNKSQMHMNAFKSQLGEKSQADVAMMSEEKG
ncbi:hypothetical protein PSH54_19220 [Pseudoalteromonas sp. Angola-30]|uniref:phage adaptor protein n=1 Tax=Pseudoalteromonas sp. Angola-30 TaxID=3025341 RepID=UPI00235A2742|nr:DUF6682 family protein [Pseudoalteromonas sp. Angola-30]MDC9527612.1 hypothetical protein [Pseudoalteromonas sp. Angola-30]